ncbi:MAG TPA: hypothetical protein VM869_00465 [Enhygromyxa sp.]|nr:hypothetical protein [Enhygromyxa sp.]
MTRNKIIAAITAAIAIGFGGGYATSSSMTSGTDNICEIERPQYCEPCGVTGPCPQGDSGWLCCSPVSGVCVVAGGSCPASHDFGYCENYTVDPASGAATCHDG